MGIRVSVDRRVDLMIGVGCVGCIYIRLLWGHDSLLPYHQVPRFVQTQSPL